jgi:hypothetical protein
MSKKLNLLALPKDKAFMRCFVAPPGATLMQLDISALEPHVFAFLSKDPTLAKVYGEGAWLHHDIYFIAGMGIPGIGDQIKQHYDIDNPSLEGIQYLKKTMGSVRSKQLKPAFLGWMYGIGAKKLSVNLEISLYEAKTILRGIDKQFPGKKWLHQHLMQQWGERGGYVINGRGMPNCVDADKKQDLNNRIIQTTGHQILQRVLYHMDTYRGRYGIQMRPYIPDFHDETIWAVLFGHEAGAKDAAEYAFDTINEELGWDGFRIKHGGINFGDNLSIRCED